MLQGIRAFSLLDPTIYVKVISLYNMISTNRKLFFLKSQSVWDYRKNNTKDISYLEANKSKFSIEFGKNYTKILIKIWQKNYSMKNNSVILLSNIYLNVNHNHLYHHDIRLITCLIYSFQSCTYNISSIPSITNISPYIAHTHTY